MLCTFLCLLVHHRVFFAFLGTTYNILIASFEILAFLVLVAVLLLGAIKLKRFVSSDLKDGLKVMQLHRILRWY
jgi:hypothetical protein